MSIFKTIALMTGGSLKDEVKHPLSVYITDVLQRPNGVFLEGYAGSYWRCKCPQGLTPEECLKRHFKVTHLEGLTLHLHPTPIPKQ